MSAALATLESEAISQTERAVDAVSRILNLCNSLEAKRDKLLEVLPLVSDDVVTEIRMSARAVGVWAWVIECACDAEVLARAERQKGGRGKKDLYGSGARAAAGQQAYLDGKGVSTVYRNARIIKEIGLETILASGTSLQEKEFYVAATSAPEPKEALRMFEDEKADNPFFSPSDAWSLVNELNAKQAKAKRKAERKDKPKPSELEFIHTPEVQASLNAQIEALQKLQEGIPANVPSVRILNSRMREQLAWQRDRTVEGDCAAILELFTGEGKKGFVQVEYASDSEIWNYLYMTNRIVADQDLDDRLELISQCSRLENERTEYNQEQRKEGHPEKCLPAHHKECQCEPKHKQLAIAPTGGKQDNRRGDMVDLYMLYDQATGDSAHVARTQNRYDSGERG